MNMNIIAITIISVIVLLVVGLVAVAFFGDEDRKEKRARKHSEKVRSEVETQVDEIRARIKDENISLDTEAGKELDEALKTCSYLIRDGYRSTDRIESVSKSLPGLEDAARKATA